MGGKKAGGGFLGIGGKSGFLNTGLLSSGPQKIKGFSMTQDGRAGEAEAIARQRAIASGQAPSISQMTMNRNVDQINQQAMAMAASQRGASNPALAFRQAQIGSQQAGLEAAQQGAILAEQERRAADDFLARQAAAQRGVAFQQSATNQQAVTQGQATQAGMISGIAQAAAKSQTGGAAHGMLIPGKAKVEGDSPKNDTVNLNVSPGEVVVPRTAVRDQKSFVDFVEGLEEEHGKDSNIAALIAAAKKLKENEKA